MKELIVHIEPQSVFRPLHSDTLFGAICFAIEHIYGEDRLVQIVERFEKSPPFLLSSAFPYVKFDNRREYFLPKPIEDIKEIKDFKKFIDSYKKFKSVKYVSSCIFNDWINRRICNTDILQNIDKYNIKEGLLYPKEAMLKFSIKSLDTPRNQINRLDNSSYIYYFNGYFCKNIGLFFMIRLYDEEYEPLLKGALKFLRDRGLGEDISVGKGEFDIKEISETKIFDLPKSKKNFITLSRYIPSLDDIYAFRGRHNLFYNIYRKRGRSFDGRLKKQVHFFTEGSTFPILKDGIHGRILHVQGKSIECGLAYSVGY